MQAPKSLQSIIRKNVMPTVKTIEPHDHKKHDVFADVANQVICIEREKKCVKERALGMIKSYFYIQREILLQLTQTTYQKRTVTKIEDEELEEKEKAKTVIVTVNRSKVYDPRVF